MRQVERKWLKQALNGGAEAVGNDQSGAGVLANA